MNSITPPQTLETDRHFAFKLTGIFESSSPSALQTKDSGIISYGRHQATLASGSLELVLKAYQQESASPLARKFNSFLGRIENKDPSLRKDRNFLGLLKQAGQEPEMERAQTSVFTKHYWAPAIKVAQELEIDSTIGRAIFFDTQVQGGLRTITNKLRTWIKTETTAPDEARMLEKFLDLREAYLERTAASKEKAGDKTTARYLRNSIAARISKLRERLGE